MYIHNHKRDVYVGTILILSLLALVACSSQPIEQTILDTQWQWSSMEETEPASISLVPNPESYTLILHPDDSFEIKADCNMVLGSYKLDGKSIAFQFGPSQMAFCGEDSLDFQYLDFMGKVDSFYVEEGKLKLILMDGAGTMIFE
jgi:heat shock protein HslJ